MSGFISIEGEKYVLRLITSQGYTLPTYFLALMRELPPSRHIAGADLDEPVGADYSRIPYESFSGAWTEVSSGISNAIEIVGPIATTEWGNLKHWALCDSAEGGNVLWAGTFTVPITIGVADQVALSPGSLSIRSIGYFTRVAL